MVANFLVLYRKSNKSCCVPLVVFCRKHLLSMITSAGCLELQTNRSLGYVMESSAC